MAEPGRTSCVDLSPTVTNSILFLLAFDFCQFCVVIRFFIPATTANDLRLWRIFYPRFYPLHLFSYLNSWERASIFPFECSVLNKGTTGTIFITSLVWRSPWLGIEASTIPLGYRGGSPYWNCSFIIWVASISWSWYCIGEYPSYLDIVQLWLLRSRIIVGIF